MKNIGKYIGVDANSIEEVSNKFKELDVNHDGIIDRNELKPFTKMILDKIQAS